MYASTGAHLYNANNWSEGMTRVVIGEGVFDVIGLKRGLDHLGDQSTLPIGSFGMQLSINPNGDDQLSKLLDLKQRGLRRVTLLWDNEPAAIKNAIKTATKLLRYGFEVYVGVLDGVKDPGEATPAQVAHAITYSYPIRNALQAMVLAKKLCP
jgi:DNA primase